MAVTNEDMNKDKNNVSTETTKKINMAEIFSKTLDDETIHTDASASTLADFLINEENYIKEKAKQHDFSFEVKEEYDRLIKKVQSYNKDPKALEWINKAYNLAAQAHGKQVRKSGEPYIIHPLSVAYILAELQMDLPGVIAALLHDVVEDTEYTREDIAKMFGEEVAFLVDGVTKLSSFHYTDKEDQQTENFRKMFLAMAKDIRVVVIKLADRLHNMRTLGVFRREKQQRIARETLEIYAPLAHRLGIYKKMKKQHKDLSQIYDLYAVRVIVDTIPQCYAVLGLAHSLWKPLPNRFKDYIAVPKPNLYQSLHTTVIGTQGQPVEIQIRTWEMHHVSEYGVAAHWRYKEGKANGGASRFDSKISWLRHILEWQDTSNSKEFVNALKLDVFSDEVFVFTPKGDVINLPQGSIPLDFAYRIHTEIGNHCVGAKVNNKMVPLDTKLKNGDIVSIVTSKSAKPSYDWLNIVGASESRSKIRSWFKHENREENIARGQELLVEEANRMNQDWKELAIRNRLDEVVHRVNVQSLDDMFAAVGYGGITPKSVILNLMNIYNKEVKTREAAQGAKSAKAFEQLKTEPKKKQVAPHGILVKGESSLEVHLAKCCNPVPGDEIIGYITRGRGVTIHRLDCPNIVNTDEPERLIEATWIKQTSGTFQVNIEIVSYDRTGLMVDILAVLSDNKTSVSSANINVNDAGVATMRLGIQIKDLQQLEYIMTKIRRVKGVHSVERLKGRKGN